jgi:DNA modification methylase
MRRPIKWRTEQRKVKNLSPASYNPRKLTNEQYKNLKKSLESFDLAEIPVINSDDQILAGHQRIKILIDLGRSDDFIDVRVPNRKLTDKECREYNIRSNRNTGEWDYGILSDQFDVGDLMDWGFDENDLVKLDVDTSVEDPDKVPEVVESICKKGDLWRLGDHLLLCGDCRDVNDYKKLMKNDLVDMLLTDPPYGVDYVGKSNSLKKYRYSGNNNHKDIKNDAISNYEQFFTEFLSIIEYSDYNTCYISMLGQELHNLRAAFEKCNYYWSDYLVWVKNSLVLGRKDYNAKHEFIMYGWKGKHKFYGESSSSTVLEYSKPHSSKLHPTMKPVDLWVRLVKDGSYKGAVVYDPFSGSGTTLVSCEMTGRKARCIELDEHYCDVIIKRWEDSTSKKAERVE